MQNRQRVWFWLAAAILFVVGFILVMNDSTAGWFLIIMGITYIGASTRAGQSWATSTPLSHVGGLLESHCYSSYLSSLFFF